MDKWNERLKNLSREELLVEAEEIEKELGLPSEVEEEPDEILKAYEQMKRGQRLQSEETVRRTESKERNKEEVPELLRRRQKRAEHRHWKVGLKKGVAAAGLAILCVISAGMTSEANRQWVIERVQYAVGDDEVIIQITDDEEKDRDWEIDEISKEIEEFLGVKFPKFAYLPSGFALDCYELNKESKIAIISYQYNGNNIFFRIGSGNKEKTQFVKPHGKISKTSIVENDMLEIPLFVCESDGEKTYLAEWEYKNGYYQLLGNIEEEILIKILKKMRYYV